MRYNAKRVASFRIKRVIAWLREGLGWGWRGGGNALLDPELVSVIFVIRPGNGREAVEEEIAWRAAWL